MLDFFCIVLSGEGLTSFNENNLVTFLFKKKEKKKSKMKLCGVSSFLIYNLRKIF